MTHNLTRDMTHNLTREKKIKTGIIGCGSIGRFLCRNLPDIPDLTLWAVADIRSDAAHTLAQNLPISPQVLSIEELLAGADLVVEAAAPDAVPKILKKTLDRGKQVVILSVGGMFSVDFDYLALAREKGGRVYFPSGAVGALDALKAANAGKIKSVTLTTRKPPGALVGAPYLEERNISLDNLTAPLEIFSGKASDAVRGFPKNINVAASISLAGIGLNKTDVRIVADPEARFNSHEVIVEGDFGKISCRTENGPSPDNPKTSYLAALSALALIRELVSPCRIGT